MLSEALDAQRRALIPGRRSTLVLLTAGGFAERLTAKLDGRLGALGLGSERLVEPHATDPPGLAALNDRIARVAEAALLRDPDAELEINAVLSTWDLDDTDVPRMLEDFSRLLARLAVGNQTLTLVLLMPPSTAQAEQLQRSAAAIRSVAAAVGTLPFLTSAFVYQLPGEIFRAEPTGADGFASQDDLLELLARNAGDEGAAGIIQHHAVSPHEAAKGLDGEQAGLSTLGLQRVVYLQHELLRYLQARFQWELFHQGLFNPALVSESRQAALTRQAEELLTTVLDDLNGRLPALATAPAYGALSGLAEATQDAGLPRLAPTDAERAIRTGEARCQDRLDEALDDCEQGLRRELDLALDRLLFGALGFDAGVVDRPGGDFVVTHQTGEDGQSGRVRRGPAARPEGVGVHVEDGA